MKLIPAIVSLFCSPIMMAQSADDFIYVAIIAEVHESEDNRLDEIEEKQMLLTSATTAMSVSSVLMANTERKLHKGLIQVYDLIDNAEVVLQIIKTSQKIMAVQDRILEHAQTYPEVLPIAASYEVIWMQKASAVLLQLLMATKESKFSIMNNAQRLTLLHSTADSLKAIERETWEIYKLIENFSLVQLFDAADVEFLIDFQEEIDNMQIQIDNLVTL